MKFPIYLDYHSTTPVDPRVLEAMLPYFNEKFGNASSKSHSFGNEAAAAVEISRDTIADYLGASKDEIVFTSGATESINLALKGVAESSVKGKNRIISTNIEHGAAFDTLNYLSKFGFEITFLQVNKEGLLSLDELGSAIDDKTLLVSIILANNEIGVIQDIENISKICVEKNVLLHMDASQGIGKVPINLAHTPVDLISFTAHKIYGPKGIGGLYIRNKTPKLKLSPQMLGGGHEKGYRSGTLNVPGIVGLGTAISLLQKYATEENKRILFLRDMLLDGLTKQLDSVSVNGSLIHRLPNNLNIRFEGVSADTLISNMKEIAVSTGSACSSHSGKLSRTLKSIGLSDEQVKSSIRFGVGRYTTEDEINFSINLIVNHVNKLKLNFKV